MIGPQEGKKRILRILYMGGMNQNGGTNVPGYMALTVFTDSHTDSPGITAIDPLF